MQNNATKITKKRHAEGSVSPDSDAFAPLLLCAVCMLLGLLATVIDRFVFSFSNELLSPVLCQILIIVLPTYLYMSLISPSRSFTGHMRATGISKFKAEYIFFLIYASAFTVCLGFALDILFGGVYVTSNGFTLLGTMTAGVGEYSVSVPYLLLCYAIAPAIIEEILFRGVLLKEFEKNGFVFATVISSVIYAAFAYSPGQIPSAIASGSIFALALSVTGSLLSCIIIHFIFNVYGLFFQPNLAQYYLSSQSNGLLIIIMLLALTASAALFFGELARIYRRRVATGEITKKRRALTVEQLKDNVARYFAHRPTLIVAIACAVLYTATFAIRIFA